MKRIVFLNAFPVSAFRKFRQFRVLFRRLDLQELKDMVRSMMECWGETEIVSYIRHPSTAKVLSEVLGVELRPHNGLYEYREGDTVIVVTLKAPPRGREIDAKPQDLDIYLITVEFAE